MIRSKFAQWMPKSMLIGEKLFDVCYEGRLCVCLLLLMNQMNACYSISICSRFFVWLSVCVPSSFFCILNKSISMPFENNVEFKFQPSFSGEFLWNVMETPLLIMYIIRVRRTLKSKNEKKIDALHLCVNKVIHNSNELCLFALCDFLTAFLFGVHKWKMCQIKLFQFRFWQLQYWKCIWTR